MTQGEGRGLDRLRRAARAVRVPDEVRAAFEAEPGDPVQGQLWRARWGDVIELVLIIEVGDEDVVTAPISVDDRYADENTVVLAPAQTSLATTVAVWAGLARRMPMCVLDRQIGIVTVDVTNPSWAEDAVTVGATRGRVTVSPIDPLNEIRARLADAMRALAEAVWAPSGTGELGQLLASASVTPQRLVDLLGVTPQRAVALRRGQVPATPDDAVKLAPVLQITDWAVLQANPAPPRALVQRMSRPRRRAQVNRLAARRGTDERSAWLAATYAVNAQAARQTGPGSEPAWDDRIDRYFQITLEA